MGFASAEEHILFRKTICFIIKKLSTSIAWTQLFYACKVRGGGAELSRANRSTPLCADWNDTSLKSLLTERMMDEIEKVSGTPGDCSVGIIWLVLMCNVNELFYVVG